MVKQWLDDSVFHHVANETSAHELWKKLESLYERKNTKNKVFLIWWLVNLKYKKGRSVAKHLNEFQSLVNQLAMVKMVLDDELQVLMPLNSLPKSWETLMVSFTNSIPNGVLSLSIFKDSMFNEKTRWKDSSADSG